ncbi:chromate efflux transporter [Thalassotalea euphylliae]|uniref:Chromate efflux transporter n=1 Tax=Thalassotalea euphylliae TaxID=1655234 RepID=A0A3E0UF30_9GAMM|nr:chromate efflux transporter [Thalassotalea euphylliae]REL34442.1 chromate efflux transporter [Thalassotalea euphylliae]
MTSLVEIFIRFFTLGCTSFGGPAAHIGYFQQAFVQQHKWLSQQEFGNIVALSQFLPGPGSSQVGFAIGCHRAGIMGGITAFVAFTLPSVVLMLLLYFVGLEFASSQTFIGVVTGLKLLAVVVVADAIATMAKSFCQKFWQQVLAVITACVLIFTPFPAMQIVLLACAAVIGRVCFSASGTNGLTPALDEGGKSRALNWPMFVLFALLLMAGVLITGGNAIVQLIKDFYVAGSLVFGGGHVVLPLLQQAVADTLSQSEFLIGYAAAQAVPGPMFTLATYLGASILHNAPVLGAIAATLAIFLPGFLLVLAFQPVWQSYASNPKIAGALAGVNAAVVGLLLAALYQPVLVSAISGWLDGVIALIGIWLLRGLKVPVLVLVACFAGLGVLLAQLS